MILTVSIHALLHSSQLHFFQILTKLEDGIVGGRDLVISKIFDKDGDGKLNTAERRNAENAIK